MIASHQPNTEPLPGYRLLEPLGKGGFGEVWKCEAPGGLVKAIKFVPGKSQNLGDDSNGAALELRALQHVKTIRHPFLLSMDRVEVVEGDLLIVMELADCSLEDLQEMYRGKGSPGIPRDELLGYMEEAAEVLDLMNQEHQLQHLDIKPRNLFLVGRHVKVADFGLVNSLADLQSDQPSSLQLGAITPTYAAPESFAGKISSSSDQYSLAIAYYELLTGSVPFDGKSFRQLAMQHTQAAPCLSALPESDRPIVARALAKNPNERFPTCGAFVDALSGAANASAQTDLPPPIAAVPDASSQRACASNATTARPRATRPVPLSQQGSPLEFAGLKLRECIARQCNGELWRATTKDDRKRLVRFLIAPDNKGGTDDPMVRLAQLKHGGLAKMDVVRDGPNRVGLVIEAGDDNLSTRLKECIQAGKPGMPRAELLDRLAEVAAALDDLREEHQIPHLTISPRTVALVGGKARLLDFGMATLFWLPAGENAGTLNPRYAAPELFDGNISPQSDQFSVGMIFVEMLTGVHPFRDISMRQMVNPLQRGAPDLSRLASADRALVYRAVHHKIHRRFASCSEFIEALSAVPQTQPGSVRSSVSLAPVSGTQSQASSTAGTVPGVPDSPAVNELVALAGRGRVHRDCGEIRYLLTPGQSIRHQCCARLVPGMIRLKLYSFRDQWRANSVERKGEEKFLFEVPLPVSFWQRVTGRLPCLAVELRCTVPQGENTTLAEVEVEIRPEHCNTAQGADFLEKVGPRLLESIWRCLNATPERRGKLRLPLELPVQLVPATEATPGEALAARTRDISQLGMSLLMASRPPWTQVCVLVSLPSRSEAVSLKARVVHVRECKGSGFEVGLAFA